MVRAGGRRIGAGSRPSRHEAARDQEGAVGRERLGAALRASLRWLGGFLRNMLVFVTMILPVAVPVAAIAAVVWLVVRRRSPRTPKDGSKEE